MAVNYSTTDFTDKDGVKLPYMTGADFEARKKAATADVTKVTAPTLGTANQAKLVKANAINREVADEETSAYQLDNILGSDSALMKRAESQGLQRGASRGLLNSSIAVEAAQGAMIDRAQPFALNDAATYFNTAESNMRANNQADLTNAQMGTELNIFNTGQNNTFKTTQAGLDSQAGIANAASANSALFSFLDRENAGFLQQNQQTFTAAQNLADRTLRENLQALSIKATADENTLNREQQTALQNDQQTFSSGENALTRAQNKALQNSQNTFASGENALNRTANLALQDDSQAFSTGENKLTRDANAAANAINLAASNANTDKTIAANLTIASNNAITAVLSDGGTTPAQKTNLIKDIRNVNLDSIDLIGTITNSANTPVNNTATSGGADAALSGVSAEGGWSDAEVDQVYNALNNETASVDDVSRILNLPASDVSAAYEQIKSEREAAAAATAEANAAAARANYGASAIASARNSAINPGLLNGDYFEDESERYAGEDYR
tara:strand:+ start:518 stop:2026 length:1509 start_codon:yes stop_codon:yes gene_type:complete